MPRLTVCGGGNAAHVLIALASEAGWEVDVFAPLADEAGRLRAGMAAAGGITARFRDRTIIGRARRVSSAPAEVIPGAEVVLLALPAFAHGATLDAVADHLDPGVRLGALPARGGFDYETQSILRARGEPATYTLFGLQTLPWACRIAVYGQIVDVLGTKEVVDLTAWPAGQAGPLAGELAPLLALGLHPVTSFLTLTLANTGQLIHPGIMYGLCRGRETATFSQEEIPLFYQGVDAATAALLERMSDEVQLLARTLAAHVPDFDPGEVAPLHHWLLRSYATDIEDGRTLGSAFVTNRAYAGLRVPTRSIGPGSFAIDFTARYLAEDVPYGLVVLRGIAALAGTPTPAIDEVINWAQARLGRQYLVDGRMAGADLERSRAPQVYGIRSLAGLAAWSRLNQPNE